MKADKVWLQCPMKSGVQVGLRALRKTFDDSYGYSREAHLNNISSVPTKPSGLGGPTDAST